MHIYTVIFLALALSVLSLSLSTRFLQGNFIREQLPHLRSNMTNTFRRATWSFFGRSLLEYMVLYFPFLVFLLVYPVLTYKARLSPVLSKLWPFTRAIYHEVSATFLFVNGRVSYILTLMLGKIEISSESKELLLCIMYSLLLGSIVSAVVFSMKFARVPRIQGQNRFLRKVLIAIKFSVYSFAGSLISLIWFMLVFFTLANFTLPSGAKDSKILILALFVMCFHVLPNTSRVGESKTTVILIVMLLFTSVMILGPSTCAAISLRSIGVGGGVPSSLLIRSVDAERGRLTTNTITGCMIMSTSSQIAVYETQRKEECLLTFILSDRPVPLESYSLVSVYSRSDILKISKW